MTTTTKKSAVVFDEFFEMGLEDHLSPFLTPHSRRWGVNAMLNASLLATFLLILAFILRYVPNGLPLSHFCLVGVYFFAGIPALIESIEDTMRLEINIDILMTLAAFSSVLIGSPMEGGMLLVLFALSGSMEDAVTEKAKGAISSLYKLSPSTATVVGDLGELHELSVKDILAGTIILIKAGEIVPLDGNIIEGASSVNLVHLTGENEPITKKVGDIIPAGAQNLEGTFTMQVSRPSTESTVARIIKLVTLAQDSKPRIQRWFDSVSEKYAATVILLTIFFAASFPLLFSMPFLGEDGSLYRSIAFLIAASPCALIIATPIAYLSAISTCARKGILIKGGVTLDALEKCSVIAFDKTGTLTKGELECVEITPLQETDRSNISIRVAYALERHAVHPIAHAIVKHAKNQGIKPLKIQNFKSVPGYGLEAEVEVGSEFVQAFIGNIEYILPKLPIEKASHLSTLVDNAKRQGRVLTILVMGEEGYLFQFEDMLRPGMKETIRNLKQSGDWRLLMLTGDHPENASKIAGELQMDEYYAELRPEDKLKYVSEISQEKGLVMVGDGINDAPALARATVGISMGKVGSTTAIEAADVVLLHDNLERLGWLMNKAGDTKKIVTQNLTLAAAVILFATTPALLGWVPLWLAVVLHEGGTVLVGLNALRLLK
ncbi:MAG: putative cadmium-transporting ATPase [Chlamydiae bacterium]|nr:putative cadmium-transporting ATPase [Chlamydiota bacterium]